MSEKRVKLNQIVKSQLPTYVQEDFPLIGEFLSKYYLGQEYQGGPIDLINNIDSYIKLSECGNIIKETTTTAYLTGFSNTIFVLNTNGFPDTNGLIKIGDEIISYESKTNVSFIKCSRGFSGVTSYDNPSDPENLVFSDTLSNSHEKGSVVENLNVLFLEQFLKKAKNQFLYGFQKDFDKKINQPQFIKQSKDFYSSRGTDESFKILFGALYGENVEVIRPIENVISPSNANYRITRDLVVEVIDGNPNDLVNRTLFQDEFENISKAYAPVAAVEKISVGILTNTYYKVSLDASDTTGDASTNLIYGNFSQHAKTKVIGQIGVGQTFIDVDSTLGFPNSGTLTFIDEDGSTGVCTYSEKTINQFIGINTTGIGVTISDNTSIEQDTFAYAADDKFLDGIRVKIRSVLKDIQIPTNTYYQKKGSKIKIKSLGKIGSNFKENNWLFNTAQSYVVKSLEIVDSVNNTFKLVTQDINILRIGDKVTTHETFASGSQWGDKITSSFDPASNKEYIVTDVFDENTCLITGTGISDPKKVTKVTRRLSKIDSDIHPNLNKFAANVQNVYVRPDIGTVKGVPYYGPFHVHKDKKMVGARHVPFPHEFIIPDENSNKVLVASSSLPFSGLTKLNPKFQKFTFSGTYNKNDELIKITDQVDHNYYTGDAVYYTPEKTQLKTTLPDGTVIVQEFIGSQIFDEGLYFVKRIDGNNVKFARSQSDINSNIFVKVKTPDGVDNVTIASNDIEKFAFNNKLIEPQKLFREIATPINDGKTYKTNPGYTGILIDGVEILNYKSKNIVYHGTLDDINILNGGDDYDVINPPVLSITDNVGSGATGTCAVKGSFKEIRILDSGFDYIEQPIIKITGGNGVNANAVAKLNSIPHESIFNANGVGLGTVNIGSVSSSAAGVNTSSIGFTTYHKFRTGERVVYDPLGGIPLVGLSTESIYYVSSQSEYLIKLHPTYDEAVSGVGTISITNFGSGVQAFKSLNGKAILSSIVLLDAGDGYENKEKTCASIGINTALNSISIKNHKFNTGEIVRYSFDGTGVDGLSTSLDYFVTAVDEDNFKLSNVGVGTTVKSFYFDTKQYNDLRSVGLGTHKFNYPPINVEVIGQVGLSSIAGKTYEAVVQPIVRGKIESINLSNTGVGYGASEILNFNRKPEINLYSGKDAVLTPVVSGGRIVDVSVSYGGTDYNSPPDLVVLGVGTDAKLTPKLNSSGNILSVNIQSGGVGYGVSSTFIRVDPAGKGVRVDPVIQKWTVNEVAKNLVNLNDDDIFISKPINSDYGLQCSVAYAPRNLRKISYASAADGKTLYGKKDLTLVNGVESNSNAHSPILGYAYDGNPIYGPYGFVNKTGGNVVQLSSGYVDESTKKTNRPPTSIFPPEFFVEDFTFKPSTDDTILDENNGRFCVTPEFPNGTYAYFATFDTTPASDGVFKNFKKPKFPYLIGDSYNSRPNKFNFLRSSGQDFFDILGSGVIRNTYPYSLNKDFSGYDYFLQSNNFVDQNSSIDFAEKGGITKVGILSEGNNYQIKDKVIFDDTIESSFKAIAEVSLISGPDISEVNYSTETRTNLEFDPSGKDVFVGIATTSINLRNNTLVNVGGLSTTSSNLKGTYNIGISSIKLELAENIDNPINTGIITFFSVRGDLRSVKENDIFKVGVGTEHVKILNVDKISKRLRVLRSANNTTGVSHTATVILEELPRTFSFKTGITTTYTSRRNKQFYFNPQEAVGISTPADVAAVGVGTFRQISNPGAGKTQIFIPSRAIYLPNHGLLTGDIVTYQLNATNETALNVKFQRAVPENDETLVQNAPLFVGRISNDFIGLSTVKIGIGSTGGFVGLGETISDVAGLGTQSLLYFMNTGVGTNHSLKTQFPVITGEIKRNFVNVVGTATHGLLDNDTVVIDAQSGLSTDVVVKYNPANRKTIFNPLTFNDSGITSATSSTGIPNTINIPNHGLVTGQKVIHTFTGSVSSLVNDKEYYVYEIDSDKISLVENQYEVTKSKPDFVKVAITTAGVLSPVNPPIKVFRGSTVNFDLSDSSLSYIQNTSSLPAFEFKLYQDNAFTKEFETTGSTNIFDVTTTGTVGVTADAKLTIKVKSNTPKLLYYKLNPINTNENKLENKQIVVDDEINLNNQILIQESKFSGSYSIVSTGSTTFTYDIDSKPEVSSFTSSDSSLKYSTISTTAYGGVKKVTVIDGGGGYLQVPGITTVISNVGAGVVLESFSSNIGKVTKTTLENIGFDYPSDTTLKPEVIFPQILRITPLTGFKSIGITSLGVGYIQNPSLITLDGVTKKEVTDIKLRYRPNDLFVEILENSESMNDATPTIIPVSNSNGIRVTNLVYDNDGQHVTATIKKPFSGVVGFSGTFIDPFPFTVGDKVLVENASVGIGSTALGFNSSGYDYARFEITEVTPNYGGIGTVKYDMSNYLSKNVDYPGIFDTVNSVATLIPDKWFPQFDVKLQPNKFRVGDEVESFDSTGTQIKGIVFDWNNSSKYLTVESNREFENGQLIEQVRFRGERQSGKTYASPTGAKGLIKEIVKFQGKYNLDYFSEVENGWEFNTGFLNDELQRIHDNNFYHAFSYALKSKVQIKEWEDIVGSLNHTAGFKKFSDLQVESDELSPASNKLSNIDPNKSIVTTLVDLIGVQSLYTVYDFDLATENYLLGVEKPFSDEINFSTRLITDYSESVSNRVVVIDDFSNIFNNNPRSTPYADVYRNALSDGRTQMFFALVSDRLFTGERQITIVNTLHDTGRGQTMLNQYGDIDTVLDLGSFDYVIDGNESVLRYFPNKFKLNNYNVVLWSYQIDAQRLGISTDTVSCGSTTIPAEPFDPTTSEGLNGSLISIATTAVTIAGGAAGTIFTLAGVGTNISGHRSAKVLVSIEAGGGTLNGSVEYDQVNLIHDGTNVGFQEYGQLTIHSVDAYSSTSNIGTYFPFMDGNDLVLSYTPDVGMTTAHINALAIGIATEGYIGIGSYDFSFAEMSAQSTGISSSSTPIPVGIASYGDEYDAAYCIVQIADVLNGSYELAEVVMIDDFDGTDPENVMLTEFGNVKVGTASAGLGTISARRTGADNEITELTFVPNAGIGVSITTFLNSLRPEENTTLLPANATREVGGEAVKDLQNASLESGFAIYEGTQVSIKRQFALESDGNPIFKKPYDGSSSEVVDLTNNTLTLPNHFFTSGQKVNYSPGAGTSIGIDTAPFSMPSSVFIIKKGEDKVQVALTAENALKQIALPVGLSTVGIGTSHTFTAIDANQKVLVAIDNMIQSPIAGTSVTTTLARSATLGDDVIHFTGITSFFGADYIRVGTGTTEEIMKIISVGIGTTNAIKVRRGWLGTTIRARESGALVEKIRGNYNIVENEINFIEAPPGKNPIGTITNPPSDRDFVGITTSSSFQGRVFTRSGVVGGTEETYTDNYLFDDISQEFNGLRKDFDLTHSNGTSIVGVATNNALILINGILQGPGASGNFTLSEPSGTRLSWTGSGLVTATRDPNASSIPIGGLIISVGSTRGFGYQPLIGAGGTAVVSLAGTINSVSIGNTGSGYRAGIQTVAVGLQTEGLNGAGITTIGLASINDGHVSAVTITNPQFFYKPRDIYNVGYSSITGITTITTAFAHNLSVGNEVVVSGIAFTCDYAPAVGVQSANYDNTTGIMTVTTLSAHGLSASGKNSDVILTGLAFTCGLGATVNHIYPRNRDRFFDTAISVASTTATSITLDVSKSPIGQQYTHTFIGAASSAVIQGGDYSHTFRYALPNAVTTGVGTQFTPTNATYNASTGVFVISIPDHGLSTNDTVGIGTSSIVFSCEMDHYGSDHPYPRPTDPIAGIQTAITAVTTNTITINVGKSELNFYDVSNATYAADTGVLVLTIGAHTLLPGRSIKLKKESLRFTCSKNNHATQHKYPREGDPVFDGTPVVGVASATQFTINAGISTVPTDYVSGGFIQPAIIAPRANNNSASKQDPAFDGATVLRVLSSTEFEINSGISTRAHLYARGGRVDQLTKIVIDEPLSYSDIPLVYSGSSPGIGGTEARADVVVSQGSTVIDFKITNLGFGYGVNQILTLPLAGIDTYFSAIGIPTTSNANFEELELTVNQVDNDQFTGWAVGQLQVLDDFSNLFNGSRRTFPISVGGDTLSIQSRPGSLVKVEDTLFVFINDILQIPGESYSFPGGATITFDEPPKAEDTLKILFYRGTGGADVVDRDVIATVKVGDTLTLGYHEKLGQKDWLQENERSVVEITSSNSVDTNVYNGPGVFEDTREKRPVKWTKQTEDLFIEGKIVSKSRELYDGRIFPTTNFIQSVGIGSTIAYLSNLRPFFNPRNENSVSTDFQKDIVIFNNAERVAAAATAVVSAAGTITSVVISDGGKGYTSAPAVTIQNPVGLGTTARAEATATIANGSVSAITVGVQSGIGYTGSNPPVVLIGAQPTLTESNTVRTFTGDSGVISGIAVTTVAGITNPTIQLDLVIPSDSDLRNANITQGGTSGITESAIAVGDYFVITNSNVGSARSSLDYDDDSVVGVGTTFIDNVYRVAAVSGVTTDAVGFGQTSLTRVIVSVANTAGLVGLANSTFYGNYSFGKIIMNDRNVSRAYTVNTLNGISGIETGVILTRKTSLKTESYAT